MSLKGLARVLVSRRRSLGGFLLVIATLLSAVGAVQANPSLSCRDLARQAPVVTRQLVQIRELRITAFNVENLFESVGRFERVPGQGFVAVPGRGPGPKSDADIRALQAVFNSTNPDIAIITEVESLRALQRLSNGLANPYRAFLIEGNDSRGIDIGFIVKADLPFHVTHETHKDMRWFDPIERRESLLFSRDLPALLLRRAEAEAPFLIVLGNHAKSMRDREGDPGSRLIRTAQYQGVAEIIRRYQSLYGVSVPIILAGDFNANVRAAPELSPIAELMQSAFDQAPVSTPVDQRITHTFHPRGGPTEARQIDDFQVTPSLFARLLEAQVYRYRNRDGSIMPFAQTYEERQRQPSDHLPITLRISTQGFW